MHQTIVVGTDGSKNAEAAVRYAFDLARMTNATVHVLAVAPVSGSPMHFSSAVVTDINEARIAIADHISDIEGVPLPAIETIVRRGQPHEQILDYADEIDADIIILGKTGADGVLEDIVGSTARRVIRNAVCPITIVN